MSYRQQFIDGQLVLAPNGHANGHGVRKSLADALELLPARAVRQSYDNARIGTDLDPHWIHADALSADAANDQTVRHRFMHRSRYEAGSNGYYAGALRTQTTLLLGGKGPSLRMMTGSPVFNQLVEREWALWAEAVNLRAKLMQMAHARFQDGETFALLQTNPESRNGVQLDFMPIEAEQVQTPYLPISAENYCDGIKFDQYGNIQWYDVLPEHPGGEWTTGMMADVQRWDAGNVLHWFKPLRPGQHRGIPDMASTLGVGATNRRYREAIVTAAETAASAAIVWKTQLLPGLESPDPLRPGPTFPLERRSQFIAPMGWEPDQFEGKHPNATYDGFHRQQLSEMVSPLLMPYNVAAHDSSTYSFASGKLDTLVSYSAIDSERADCNERVLNRLFAAWFREWTIISARRDIPPAHQWDWPAHPVIDEVAHANATDTKLKNCTTTLRQVHSDAGNDIEDIRSAMAEDIFGEVTEETIDKVRQIMVLSTTPQPALPFVAQILGIEAPQQTGQKRDLVEAIQKIYLGVGRVITSDEARQILNREYAGGLKIPGPDDLGPANPTPDESAQTQPQGAGNEQAAAV